MDHHLQMESFLPQLDSNPDLLDQQASAQPPLEDAELYKIDLYNWGYFV